MLLGCAYECRGVFECVCVCEFMSELYMCVFVCECVYECVYISVCASVFVPVLHRQSQDSSNSFFYVITFFI